MTRIRWMIAALLLIAAGTSCAADVSNVALTLESKGILATLLLVYAGGLLVSLTPCVYPMIPITLGIIGARNAQQSPLVGLIRSLTFVLGIVVVYAALGIIAVKTGKQVSFAFQNPWVIGTISVFFIIMGAAMFDMFTLQMPAGLSGRLQTFASSHSAGLIGAFILGCVTGIVASPCGSPVLAGVVAVAAAAETTGTGVLLLAAYALGLGTLFIFLGTFPAFLGKLPRSGTWMNDIKKMLGLLLILVGVYLLRDALTAVAYLAVLLCGIAVGVALCVVFAAKSGSVYMWAVMAAAISVAGAWECAALRSSTVAVNSSSVSQEPVIWLTDLKAAKETALRENKPILVDFGAEWCAACKKLEKETFSNPEVAQKLKRFVTVKIDCTEETPENEALQKEYQALTLPTIVFLYPDGRWNRELSLYQFENPEQFLERLAKMP